MATRTRRVFPEASIKMVKILRCLLHREQPPRTVGKPKSYRPRNTVNVIDAAGTNNRRTYVSRSEITRNGYAFSMCWFKWFAKLHGPFSNGRYNRAYRSPSGVRVPREQRCSFIFPKQRRLAKRGITRPLYSTRESFIRVNRSNRSARF